ncbi:MAG: T9SS type A sorting domain-containing protein [Bacteroidales bacterium]
MIKNRLLLFAFLTLFGEISLFAQPALTFEKHALRSNDIHQTQKVTNVDHGLSGANIDWDFSNIKMIGDVYQESLAEKQARIFVTNPKSTAEFQFDVTPYGNDYYGVKTDRYNIVYDNPILKTRYPFRFLDEHDGEYSGKIIQGNSTTLFDGSFSSIVDGYGTLKLPNNIVLDNVLRVKTVEERTEFYCQAHHYEEVKYVWYSQDFRYPVFIQTISTSTLNNTPKQTVNSYVNVDALVPVKTSQYVNTPFLEPSVDVEYRVYPNPVETTININYILPFEAKVSVAIYSVANVCERKLVDGQQQVAGTYSYTYAPRYPGIYFIRFAFGNKVYTEKIVKK